MNYVQRYNEKTFWRKLAALVKAASVKVVYVALLLYYTAQKPNLPKKVKRTIYGALGYLIFPFDALADMLPFVGFTDDLGALLLALGICAMYVDGEVKEKARSKMREWFGRDSFPEMVEVDKTL